MASAHSLTDRSASAHSPGVDATGYGLSGEAAAGALLAGGTSSALGSGDAEIVKTRDAKSPSLTELKSPIAKSQAAEAEHRLRNAVVWFGCVEAKYVVCGLLVAQNTGAVLLMRYTRSMPGEGEFVTQTAVIMQECLKGAACVGLLARNTGRRSATKGAAPVESLSSAWEKPREALKTCVPALLYLVQNNLQYVAVTYLDAATYTVSYQTKIVWSGVLSVVLLNRRLSVHKWLGIALLALGVATVQIAGSSSSSQQGAGAVLAQQQTTSYSWAASTRAVGFLCVVCAAVVSALAGVYFEKILKGAKVGLWTRNLQLAFYSVIVGYAKFATSAEGRRWRAGDVPFFYGYTPLTWLCVATNAFGGLLVGTVIRYADAVAKDVALGCSIVLSSLISTVLFDFRLNGGLVAGIAGVVYAVFLYGERVSCCGLVHSNRDSASTTRKQQSLLPVVVQSVVDTADPLSGSDSPTGGKIVPTNGGAPAAPSKTKGVVVTDGVGNLASV